MMQGFCEDVVGRFSGEDVRFHSKLKKPVMTKRTSSSGRRPASSRSTSARSPVPTPSSEVATPPSPSDLAHVHIVAVSPSPQLFASPDQSRPSSPPSLSPTPPSPIQTPKSAGGSPVSPRRFKFPRQPILTISNPDEASHSRETSPTDEAQTFAIPLRTQSLNYHHDANGSTLGEETTLTTTEDMETSPFGLHEESIPDEPSTPLSQVSGCTPLRALSLNTPIAAGRTAGWHFYRISGTSHRSSRPYGFYPADTHNSW